MENISSAQIWWAILAPKTGKANKEDAKKLGAILQFDNVTMIRRFEEKRNAIEWAKNSHGLRREYECRFITDKQFGMIENVYRENRMIIPYTAMQYENVVIVK